MSPVPKGEVMPTRRALVVGAGIAGLATALRLRRSDWEVVLTECESPAPSFPHTLHGAGHDAATRLGLLPALDAVSQPRCDTVLVDTAGKPFAERLKPSMPVLCRDDVVAVLRQAVGDVETRWNAEVIDLLQDNCGVTTTFSDGSDDWFDLVVGADGARPVVRGAVCGQWQRRHRTFAMVPGRLARGLGGAVSMELAERSARFHPLHDGGTAVLFTWRGDALLPLHTVFGDLEWLTPAVLSEVDGRPATRSVCSGIHVDRWASRQIALVGDAAWCAERHHADNASLAISGAELLGDALDIFTDTAEALMWWEKQMRRTVRRQNAAGRARGVVEWSSQSTRSAS